MNKKKTVVVLSGGLDSVTLLWHLKSLGHELAAISFNYGQRHVKELECATYQAKKMDIPHKIVDMTFLPELIDSTLLTNGEAVPEGHYADENMKQTVVPNRNMIMASIATAWAITLGFDHIALGVHAGDNEIYPDCRPAFIDALSATTQLCDYHSVSVIAPFIEKSKIDIVGLGLALGVDYGNTWTCYMGNETPGRSSASVARAEAFLHHNTKDPLYTDDQWAEMTDYMKHL